MRTLFRNDSAIFYAVITNLVDLLQIIRGVHLLILIVYWAISLQVFFADLKRLRRWSELMRGKRSQVLLFRLHFINLFAWLLVRLIGRVFRWLNGIVLLLIVHLRTRFLPWNVAWNVECTRIFIKLLIYSLGTIQGSASQVDNFGEVPLSVTFLFFIIQNYLLLLLLLSWNLIVHHFTWRMGSVRHFVQLLWGIDLNRLNTVRVRHIYPRVCVEASSELASNNIVSFIVVRGIGALETCFCWQIGLLKMWDLVWRIFLDCTTNSAENSGSSHSSWGSWSALIISQVWRWFMSRIILAGRLF